MKIVLFSVKPFTTLTCRNSLINQVTNEFYFGILIRVANETGCDSLIDQWRSNFVRRDRPETIVYQVAQQCYEYDG